MNYSIIIPSYNAAATITACLHALTQQQFQEPYEIIVVDSSTDATPDLIRTQFPSVLLIHLGQRTDPGTARNLGIQHAQGAILCFIDADCVAAPDWLERIRIAQQGDCAAVGGAVMNGNPRNLIGWAGYLAEFREWFPFQPKQRVRHCASCNIAYKRRVFEQYGLFPPDFYPQEDLVFNERLYTHRETVLFDPAVRVSHVNKTSPAHFFRHQYRIGRITAEVLKHYPALKGSALASFRGFSLLAFPALPLVKWLNTLRVAAKSPAYLWRFLLLTPLLLPGLYVWGAGFTRGAFLPRRVPRKILGERQNRLKWEIVRWVLQILSGIPGETGAFLRRWLIRFRSRGANIRILEHVWIERPDNLSIGENCRINRGVYIQATGGVDIGSNVGIGPGAIIYSMNHKFAAKDQLYMDQGYTPERVVIEDDVWIGAYAKILPGVTLKQGTVVGAGTVVTKDTEPYAIVVGVPAKVIGYRT